MWRWVEGVPVEGEDGRWAFRADVAGGLQAMLLGLGNGDGFGALLIGWGSA